MLQDDMLDEVKKIKRVPEPRLFTIDLNKLIDLVIRDAYYEIDQPGFHYRVSMDFHINKNQLDQLMKVVTGGVFNE